MKLLDINSGLKKYLKNTYWLLTEKITKIAAALFVGVWVARYLGPERLGLLSYAQSIVALFASFSTMGLNNLIYREFIYGKVCADILVCNSICIIFFGSSIAYVMLNLFLVLSDAGKAEFDLIQIIGLSIFSQVYIIFEAYFQSQLKSKKIAIAALIGFLTSSIIKVILILTESSLTLFALSYVLEGMVILTIYICQYNIKFSFNYFQRNFSYFIIKNIIIESWPLLLSSLLISIYVKIDQIMIKNFLGDYEVGQYAVAARISEAWYFVPVAITSSLYPSIVNSKERDPIEYKKRSRDLYSLMVYISLPVSLIFYIMSDKIVIKLYGEEYYSSSGVLKIHIWASVFVFIGMASSRWLLTERLQVYSTLNTFIGALSNILLNWLLIPKYGIQGAAWATLISYAIAGYFSFLLWKKTREQFWIITKSCFNYRLLSNRL